MKLLLFIFTMLTFAAPTFAQEQTPKKSFVAEVIESMAEEYMKTLVRNTAVQAADRIAQQALGKAVEGKISTALSIYGVIQNINAYNDASSETQRYQAASHAMTDAITAGDAAMGAIVQVGVIIQDLSAAYVYKDYLIQFARLREEIVQLQKNRSDLIKSEYDAEDNAFKKILSKAMAANQLAKTSSEQLKITCGSEEISIQFLNNCYEKYKQHLSILRAQKFLLEATIGFQGRFINIPSLLQNADLTKDFKSFIDDLNHSDDAINSAQNSLNEVIRLISDFTMRNIQGKLKTQALTRSCERQILKRTMDLIKNRKADIMNENKWSYESSDDISNDLHLLLTVTCKFVIDKVDPEILKIASLQ